MGGSYYWTLGVRRALAAAIVMAGLASAPPVAFAAVGEVIRTVVLPAGGGPGGAFCVSGWGTSIAVVPGASVGLPNEPVLLVTSCNSLGSADAEAQASKLYFFRPSQGGTPAAPLLTVTTVQLTEGGSSLPFAPPRGWGALALRSDKNDLIACGNKTGSGTTHPIFMIPLSKSFATSEAPTTTPVKLFDGEPGISFATFCDGVAWDAVDNRIYQSPDVFDTVYRFTETGQQDGTLAVPVDCNGSGASGVAVSGQNLYLGCADDPEIYRVDKSTGAVIEVYGSPQLRTEDLECDPRTFAVEQKDALWTKGGTSNDLIAVEVPRGTCGGAVPVAASPLCSDMTDTDGDGLLDCWERPSPTSAGAGQQPCIDFDGDGLCDLTLCVNSGAGTVCADPYRKDVFVEVDWLSGHKPLQNAITRVINKFAVAPVANPVNPATGTSVSGIRLHVQVDPEALKDASGATIPHTGSTNHLLAFEPYTAAAAGTLNVLDFDQLKKNNFGISAAERANPKALDAKRQAFRYMMFAHLLVGLGGTSGAAEVHGNDGVVTLGASSSTGHGVGSEDQQAGTFFHELGHLLGLRHGGADMVNCKPNYLSIMNYTRQFPGAPIGTTQWRTTAFDFSRSQLADLDKSTLNENAGVKSPGGVPGDVTAFGPTTTAGVLSGTGGAINWDRDSGTDASPVGIPLLNKVGTGCPGDGTGLLGTLLAGHNDWANLKYDVRASLDIADGDRFTLLDKEPEQGFAAPADNPCTAAASCPVILTTTENASGQPVVVDSDSDGIADLVDNCPTVANANQADANGDGIGDACPETQVAIDIRPTRYPNVVDVESIIPLAVAILGSPTFDATKVNPSTVRLSGARVPQKDGRFACTVWKVNEDNILDFVCIVDKRQLVLPSDNAVAVLTGRTFSNAAFRGEDSIHIVRSSSDPYD